MQAVAQIQRQDHKLPMLKSERFRITTHQPPYGGIDRYNELGSLIGQEKGGQIGFRPLLSKDQIETELAKKELDKAKEHYNSMLKHRAKIHESQVLERNRRRTYLDDPRMKRWVGTSINFEQPEYDKVAVKMSRKMAMQKKPASMSRHISALDVIRSQYDFDKHKDYAE